METNPPVIAAKCLKRKSTVWNYFSQIDDQIAQCDICGKPMSRRGTLTNLKRHLERKHLGFLSVEESFYHGERENKNSVRIVSSRPNENGDEAGGEDDASSVANNFDISTSENHQEVKTSQAKWLVGKTLNSKISSNRRPSHSEWLRSGHSASAPQASPQQAGGSFGQYICAQLAELENLQRTVADKLISDVIFYGKLGQLTASTRISLGPIIYKTKSNENNQPNESQQESTEPVIETYTTVGPEYQITIVDPNKNE